MGEAAVTCGGLHLLRSGCRNSAEVRVARDGQLAQSCCASKTSTEHSTLRSSVLNGAGNSKSKFSSGA